MFPGIQLTRVALKHLAKGQIATANNKTYKEATSRAGIFVWFRGMNIFNISYPRNRELEGRMLAFQYHGTAHILITLTLKFFFCLTIHLSYGIQIYALFALLSVTFLYNSWKDGTIQVPVTILPLTQSP